MRHSNSTRWRERGCDGDVIQAGKLRDSPRRDKCSFSLSPLIVKHRKKEMVINSRGLPECIENHGEEYELAEERHHQRRRRDDFGQQQEEHRQ